MQRFRRQSHCGENNDNEIDHFLYHPSQNTMRGITCSTPLGCLIIPLSSEFSDQLQTEISDYFHGTRYTFSTNLLQAVEEVVLSLGTPFQQAVSRFSQQIKLRDSLHSHSQDIILWMIRAAFHLRSLLRLVQQNLAEYNNIIRRHFYEVV